MSVGCAVAVQDGFTTGTSHDGGGDGSPHDASLEPDGGSGDGAIKDTGGGTGEDSGSGGDSAKTDGSGSDATGADSSGTDTGTTGIDSGVDTGKVDTGVVDTGFDAGFDSGSTGTTVSFPTATSSAYSGFGGVVPLGTGGSSGYHYVTGDYVEQAYAVPASVTAIDLDFTMYDGTAGCAIGKTNAFSVKLNGTAVGTFSWVSTGGGATKPVSQKYTFGAIAPSAGKVTIRVEATSTVCSGGSTWNWNPGGTATMR